MKWWTTVSLAVLASASLMIAACGGDNAAPSNRGKSGGKAQAFHPDVPADYKDRKPPAGLDLKNADVIAKGKELFANADRGNCVSCHGASGKGDGPLGASLDPKPSDLTDPAAHELVTDAYIFWRIKTGNAGWGNHDGKVSGMAGFANGSDEDIWQVVAYVRSLNGK